MLSPSRAVRVFAYPVPADLRKGYNGLFGLVTQGLNRDPMAGDLYLFLNRKRSSCKVLLWDGTGLCIFMKRLEKGRFANIWRREGDSIQLTGGAVFTGDGAGTVFVAQPLSPAVIKPG